MSAVSSNCTRARFTGGLSRLPASDRGADDGSGEDSKSITTILRFLPVVDDAPDFDLEDLDDLRMEGGGDEVIGVVVDVRLVGGGRTAIAVIQTGD